MLVIIMINIYLVPVEMVCMNALMYYLQQTVEVHSVLTPNLMRTTG